MRNTVTTLLLGFLLASIATACGSGNSTHQEIDNGQSVIDASTALSNLGEPSLLLNLAAADASTLIQQEVLAAGAQTVEGWEFNVQSLDVQTDQQSITVHGEVVTSAGDGGVEVLGQLHGSVGVALEGVDLVLRPELESLTIESVRGINLAPLPEGVANSLTNLLARGVNFAISTFISRINEEIEPIRETIDVHPLGTPDKPGDPIVIPIDDKTITLPAPILTGSAILIDSDGVHVLAALRVSVDENANDETGGGEQTAEFDVYQQAFRAAALNGLQLEGVVFGETGLHLSESFMGQFLSALPEVTSVQQIEESIRASSRELAKITTPTLLANISTEDTETLIATQLNTLQERDLSPLSISDIRVALDEQSAIVEADVTVDLMEMDARVHGELTGLVSPSIEGTDIVLRPAFDTLKITNVEGIDLSELPMDVNDALFQNIVATTNMIIRAALDHLNAQIEPIREPIDVQPLGTPGSPPVPITFKVGNEEHSVPAPLLIASALLIDSQGIHLLGELSLSTDTVLDAGDGNGDFSAYQATFRSRALEGLMLDEIDFSATGVFLNEAFLAELLADLPALTSAESQHQATMRSVDGFNGLVGPDFGVVLSAELVKQEIEAELLTRLKETQLENVTISHPKLDLGQQAILISADIEADLSELSDEYALRLRGALSGTVALSIGADGRLLAAPTFSGIRIDTVENLNEADGTLAVGGMVSGINSLLGAAIQHINASPDLQIEAIALEIKPFDTIDLTAVFDEESGISLSRDQITPPAASVPAAALLINDGALMILADVALDGMAARERALSLLDVTDLEPAEAHERYQNALVTAWESVFQTAPPTSNAAAVLTKSRLADLLNHTWQQVSDLTASYTFDTGSEQLESEKITLYQKPTIECSNVSSCSRRTCPSTDTCTRSSCPHPSCDVDFGCGREPGECDWSCRVTTPLGSFDDPICLSTRAACNAEVEARVLACTANEEAERTRCNIAAEAAVAACNLDEEAKVAECNARIVGCNVDADSDYATCQATRGLEELGCNVAREWHDWAGDIGRVSGDIEATGTVQMRLGNMQVASDWSRLALRPIVAGTADFAGNLNYTPADIGHILICPWPGTVRFASQVSIPQQIVEIEADINVETVDAGLLLTAEVEPILVDADLDPSPARAILQQNPAMTLACEPALAAQVMPFLTVTGEALALSDEDLARSMGRNGAIFTGRYTHEIEKKLYEFIVPPVVTTLPSGASISLTPRWAEQAVYYTVDE